MESIKAGNSPMNITPKIQAEDERSLYKDILNHIQSAGNKINQYHTKFAEKEVLLDSANQEIDRLNSKCLALEAELKTLKEAQCKNCTKLKKIANEYRKKSMETEGRLKLITNIISNSNKSQSQTEAYSFATQALFEGSLQDTVILEESKENSQELVSSSSSSNSKSLKRNLKGAPLDTLPVNIINHEQEKIDQNEINNISQEIFVSDSSKKSIIKTESKTVGTSPQKSEWKLHKVRECGNKLKQTKLSLSKFKEKKDISTLTTFNGGILNKDEDVKLKLPDVENKNDLEETFFEPAISSTENPKENIGGSSPVLKKKKQSSPNYKYRRDAIRKKADRMRLPGQDCQKCAEFYENPMLENIITSKSQTKNLMQGCSRHRDKYPLRQHTPEGFWDPVFDDTLEN